MCYEFVENKTGIYFRNPKYMFYMAASLSTLRRFSYSDNLIKPKYNRSNQIRSIESEDMHAPNIFEEERRVHGPWLEN